MTERNRDNAPYLMVEQPDRGAVIDFMGPYPVTIKIDIDENGLLWIVATSATQGAPILIDETADVPEADEED